MLDRAADCCAPPTTDVEQPVAGLQIELAQGQVDLVPLGLLERHPRRFEIGAAIRHRRIEEEREKVVREVVVGLDLPVERLELGHRGLRRRAGGQAAAITFFCRRSARVRPRRCMSGWYTSPWNTRSSKMPRLRTASARRRPSASIPSAGIRNVLITWRKAARVASRSSSR